MTYTAEIQENTPENVPITLTNPSTMAVYDEDQVSSLLAHLSRRLRGELIVYRSSRRPSVRACVRLCVCVFTLSNMNISETNRSIATKFYLKHHLGGGLAALGFKPDRIRTLVSMATESSHRVIMVKTVSPLFLGCFSSDPFHTCR